MVDGTTSITLQDADDKSQYALTFVKQVMLLPGATVDREAFLRRQLASYCPERTVDEAIATSPPLAGIHIKRIDSIADSVIKSHLVKAGAASFTAGLPGGLFLLATVPADTVQFMRHAVILSQKLAYLYGWPNLVPEAGFDDETEIRIAMLLGTMLGMGQANVLLKGVSRGLAQQIGIRVPRQALTKTFYYPALKKALRWIGIRLTKQSFAKGISKAVPVIGGVASAGMTTVSLRRMARSLKDHLRELEFAQPTRKVLPIQLDG